MHWYLEAMKKYGVFSGRARRKEYWYFQLINTLILIVLSCACFFPVILNPGRYSSPAILAMLLLFTYCLAIIIPSLAVSVRRLHDTDFSGWWVLIALVPFGGVVLLIFHLMDSTPGPNRYGPNPKGIGAPVYAAQYVPSEAQAMTTAAGAGPVQLSHWFLGFCNACGTQMQAGTRFCPKCGKAAY